MKYTFLNKEYEFLGGSDAYASIKVSDGTGCCSFMPVIDFMRYQYKYWPNVFHGVYRSCEVYDGYNVDEEQTFHNCMEKLMAFEQGRLCLEPEPVVIIYDDEKDVWSSPRLVMKMCVNKAFEVHSGGGSTGCRVLDYTRYPKESMNKWRDTALMLCIMYRNIHEKSWDNSIGSYDTTLMALEKHIYEWVNNPNVLKTGIWAFDILPIEQRISPNCEDELIL